MLKKICVLILILASLCVGLFAVPGIKPLVPDVSGQFVYYRDYTFPNEAYIGILHYDEGTYAVRFYSCENGKTLKDITIYVTMNTAADYIDLTGEKIVGTTGNQNIDMIEKLDIRNFNTKNVRDMSYMFNGLSFLISLDVSNFNTENVMICVICFMVANIYLQ